MTTGRRRVAFFSGWLILGLSSAFTVSGGTVYNFESCNLGPIGDWSVGPPPGPPPGCDGWYTPQGQNTAPGIVYAYSSFPPFVAVDPAGGNNVLVLTGNGSGDTQTYDRAQHNFTFSSAAAWSFTNDFSIVNVNSTGNSYLTNYIGGFGALTAGNNTAQFAFVVDYAWDDSSASSTWSPVFWVYDADGNPLNPDDGVSVWTGFSQNHWYNETTVFDLNSNRILSVSITDLTTNQTYTDSPAGWYMAGGAAGPTSEPNAVRFSGLGPNNGFLVDNVGLDPVPEPATLLLTGLGLIALIAFRRR